jgi:DNA polymerase
VFAIIDFETRSRTSIKAGASRYSLDAEVMCLSYQIGDGPVKSWRPGEPEPDDLLEHVRSGEPVYAHNAAFEMAIWRNVCVPQFEWPEVAIEQWHCTQAESLAMALPGALAKVGEALGLAVQKDDPGHRLMLKMSKPRKPTKHDKSEWHEKPEDILRLRQYCDQDVLAERAVHDAIPRLSKREQSVYTFDAKVNLRGVKIDRELAESVVDVWGQYTRRLNAEISEITFGHIPSSDSVKAITQFLPKIGAPMASLDKAAVTEALATELPSTARRILEIRQSCSLSSIAKFEKMLECIEPDDRIRGCFQYHGASPGRWAGRLVQLQNLPRGELKQEQLEGCVELVKSRDLNRIELFAPLPFGKLLSSLCRSAIIADKGKKLLVSDFASVEARGLAWAAGEDWLLDAFRDKKDAYKEMASTIYGIPTDKVTKDQRFYGKTAVLGAGYGLGPDKFRLILAQQGVFESEEFCKAVIDTYRKKNRKIVKFWYAVERAAVNAVKTKTPQKAGPFTFHMQGQWLLARMPCGRDIAYYKPTLSPGKYNEQLSYLGVDPTTGKIRKEHTYSGKIVENLTQAICRDLLVEAMARLEKRGYQVIAHIHDEVVCEVERGSIEEMEAIMSEVPKWAEGFPVGAEGFECTRYRK